MATKDFLLPPVKDVVAIMRQAFPDAQLHEVRGIVQNEDGGWTVISSAETVKNETIDFLLTLQTTRERPYLLIVNRTQGWDFFQDLLEKNPGLQGHQQTHIFNVFNIKQDGEDYQS